MARTSSDYDHSHSLPKGKTKGRTSVDMDHDHSFNLKNKKTGPGGKANHRHTIPESARK